MKPIPENYDIVKTVVGEARLQPIPTPRLRGNYILVKTIAVAINPTDWQMVDKNSSPATKGSTLVGRDFAGIMVEIGKGVKEERKKGDRIAGVAHGVKGDVVFHILESVSFEEAASSGVGVTTVALGLYKYLSLPLLTFPLPMTSPERKLSILIYERGSTTGTLASQFAKILHHIFDTIATQSTAQICADALSTSGDNLYVNLIGIEILRDDVRNTFFLGYPVTGEEYEIKGEVWPAVPEDFELGKRAFVLLERIVKE
ncbi:hypothetical protein BOTCAL_0275g00130 [Botryotinia calthae]|uniref:Alcohol dehydrogenase-like N-terminal domain-containing protein n=1 Tax=Botryotinia calthae TaxID=38488 RepID=A0A4Y8CVJ8_9HELO|nr:hypothetical protein BOTCAL_0275g00130 [Botryotinia calthae]